MTTRHTISHADELYAGQAFLQGTVSGSTVGSPDGRRGIPISHIYVREYGAVLAADDDGLMDSYAPSTVITDGVQHLSGVYALAITTPGVTQFVMDVPRNLAFMCTSCGVGEKICVEGRDEYGQYMVETISQLAAAGTYSYGTKAWKVIDKIYTTWAVTSALSIGAGPALGLPYHLSSKTKFLGLSVDGAFASANTALVTGLALSADASSSAANPDVRGTVTPATAANGTLVFSAMMVVDHTSRDKAYGVPQATVVT